MKSPVRTEPQSLTKPAALGLGERLRRLRVAAGLTQGELAGDRFSKEYVSQIERGKTRPTPETIEWLAQQLGVDASFLANGVSTDERGRVEGGLARAEALIRSDQCPQALEVYDALRSAVAGDGLARAGSSRADRRGACAWDRRRRSQRDSAARARPRTFGGRELLRRRARRGPLRAGRRPLQAFEHLDCAGTVQRGARARRALRVPV